VKKSIETRSRTSLARNVRQVCDLGERRVGSSRETVRSATSIPSFMSSRPVFRERNPGRNTLEAGGAANAFTTPFRTVPYERAEA
jgi:hypothetical protein